MSASRFVYAQAAIAAPLFWLALRVCGPAKTISFAHRLRGNDRRAAASTESAQALAGAVNAAVTRTLGPNQCLTRSLVLQWMLARRGIDSSLRIGVRREGAQLVAHAWVEADGAPVNDSLQVTRHYAAFEASLPLAAFHAGTRTR